MQRMLRGMVAGVLLLLTVTAVHGAWPFTVGDSSSLYEALDLQLGESDDLYVLATHHQIPNPKEAVLLRINSEGSVVWEGVDPQMSRPVSFALRPDGSALVAARQDDGIRVTAFSALDGSIMWSRERTDLEWTPPLFSEHYPSPIWSEVHVGWRIPLQKGGDFAVAGWNVNGEPTPDWIWTPHKGSGGASSVRARPDGGLYVAGSVQAAGEQAPGWWIVASDASGVELWSDFEDGDTQASIHSNPSFLAPWTAPVGDGDPLIAWANDETNFGLFSLRIWSLDTATGNLLWATTWPPPGMTSFDPESVVLSAGSILATGSTDAFGSSGDAAVLSFDANTGALNWEAGYAVPTSVLSTAISSGAQAALLSASLFPVPNGSPTPLRTAAWNPDGTPCSDTPELLPTRVVASVYVQPNSWFALGNGSAPGQFIIQRLGNPCTTLLFADGFEPFGP